MSEAPAKPKRGLQTLHGHYVGTITKAEYDRIRAEDPVHVVQPERSHNGGEAA